MGQKRKVYNEKQGEHLAEWMEKAGLKQTDLAKKLSVHFNNSNFAQQTIWKVLNGKRDLTVDEAMAIAKITFCVEKNSMGIEEKRHTRVEYLLGIDDFMFPRSDIDQIKELGETLMNQETLAVEMINSVGYKIETIEYCGDEAIIITNPEGEDSLPFSIDEFNQLILQVINSVEKETIYFLQKYKKVKE